jgi:predicted transcriptional regulator
MGRPRLELDEEKLLDMSQRGLTQRDIADEMGVSIPTVAATIKRLQTDQGLILQYREVETLRATSIKHDLMDKLESRILNGSMTTDEVIKGISVMDKLGKEDISDAKIDGLIGHLMQIQKDKSNDARDKADFQRASINIPTEN